jgi:DNA replication and repair protein RecF
VRLSRLELSYFRNLTAVGIDLAPGLNVFFGDNGAGKTALLEAVHLLCRGRSFRTQKVQSLIQHGAEQLVVRGVLEDRGRGRVTLAIAKDRHARTELKVDGRAERRLSQVARMTPLQVMLPDIAELVFGGPAGRRSWLDWGTFHVKPDYLARLRRYLRAIKQRNALLKEAAPDAELTPWSEEAAELGQAVTADRREYLALFGPHFRRVLKALAPELAVELEYHPGWPRDHTLDKLLGDSSVRELKYGSTLWGPHRGDVRLRTNGNPASGVLSRGQGKILASALQIGQAALLAEHDQRSTIFLIDDAGAELDAPHGARFFGLLDEIGGQILATTTRRPSSEGGIPLNRGRTDAGHLGVFHVEHGQVQPMEKLEVRE